MLGVVGLLVLAATVPVTEQGDRRLSQIEEDLSVITRVLRSFVTPESHLEQPERRDNDLDVTEIEADEPVAPALRLVSLPQKTIPLVEDTNIYNPYDNKPGFPFQLTVPTFMPTRSDVAPAWDTEEEHRRNRVVNAHAIDMPESANTGNRRVQRAKDTVTCPGEPYECSNRGMCDRGTCRCDPRYYGPDCGLLQCFPRCADTGMCANGTCVCRRGWAGPLCSDKACYPDCVHGECVSGRCLCAPGFQGDGCEWRICPGVPQCGPVGHGHCNFTTGHCACALGWTGEDCTVPLYQCPYRCLNGGSCNNGTCACTPGWEGLDCGLIDQKPYACAGGAVWNEHGSSVVRTCATLDVPEEVLSSGPSKAVAKCTCPAETPVWHEPSQQCVDASFCLVSACGAMPDPRPNEVVLSVKGKEACGWTDPQGSTGGTCGGLCVSGGEDVTVCYKAGHHVTTAMLTAASAGIVLFRQGEPCPGEPDIKLSDLATVTSVSESSSAVTDPDQSTVTYTHTVVTVSDMVDFSGLPVAVLTGKHRHAAGSVRLRLNCLGSYTPKLVIITAAKRLSAYGDCLFAAENSSCPGIPPCHGNGVCHSDLLASSCECAVGYLPPACESKRSPNATTFLPNGVPTLLPIPPNATVVTASDHILVTDPLRNASYAFYPNGTVAITQGDTLTFVDAAPDPQLCVGGTEWQPCAGGCFPTCRNPSPRCLPSCLHGACQCPIARPVWDDAVGQCVSFASCTPPAPCPGIGAVCGGHGQCVNGSCVCAPGYRGDDCSVYAQRGPRVTTASGTVQATVPCHLPFTFRGTEYRDCTTDYDSEGREWCSVTGDWEHRWGYCAPRGSCPAHDGLACSGRGACSLGTCVCQPTFYGDACQYQYVRYTNATHAQCSFPFLGPDLEEHFDCIPGVPVVDGDDIASSAPLEGTSWCLTSFRYEGPLSVGFCAPKGTCGPCVGGLCDPRTGLCVCRPGFAGAACDKALSERDILVDLYAVTRGSEWLRSAGWGADGSPCGPPAWTGVTCRDGHVIRLNLDGAGLTGTIPAHLAALTQLELLDLSNNALVGTFPSVLMEAPVSLQYISVSSNYLVGSVPPTPPRIVYADFRQNYVTLSDGGEAAPQTRVTNGVGPAPEFTLCAFPFEYHGRNYSGCTTEWSASGAAWCSTTRGYSGQWGMCAPPGTCPGTNGVQCSGHGQCVENAGPSSAGSGSACVCEEGYAGLACERTVHRVTRATVEGAVETGQQRPCALPFAYGGRWYRDCTTEHSPSGEAWCLTTATWERKWGYCAPEGTCAGRPDRPCSGHGECVHGRCLCDPDHMWDDCSQPKPRVTSGRFHTKGMCCHVPFSFNGTVYDTCAIIPALAREPICATEEGDVAVHRQWDVCAERGTCPGNPSCSDNGDCYDGECACHPGFKGVDCSTVMSEHDVLVDLFRSTHGPQWRDPGGWEVLGSPCDWHGVRCDGAGRVVAVSLSQNNLDGTVPASLYRLQGLETLDLSHNHLAGSLPPTLSQMTGLRTLNVEGNQLSGPLPPLAATPFCDGNCIDSPACARGTCQYPF